MIEIGASNIYNSTKDTLSRSLIASRSDVGAGIAARFSRVSPA